MTHTKQAFGNSYSYFHDRHGFDTNGTDHLLTLPTTSGHSGLGEFNAGAARGSDVNSYHQRFKWKNVGGTLTVTLIDSPDVDEDAGLSGLDATVVADYENIVLQTTTNGMLTQWCGFIDLQTMKL